ncbi:MAG: response regulator [Candidatus Omnitrophica bacterium]|nr:response regulator [Candidatus Omnitrophota bacterium]
MRNAKILIVDDEPDLLELLKTTLVNNGYDVVTANDGLQGLEQVENENPDLILLDIKMPRMDGYTMLRELKKSEKTKHVPVIMLTVYDKMKDIFELEGVKGYMIKSSNDQEILAQIKKILEEQVG